MLFPNSATIKEKLCAELPVDCETDKYVRIAIDKLAIAFAFLELDSDAMANEFGIQMFLVCEQTPVEVVYQWGQIRFEEKLEAALRGCASL